MRPFDDILIEQVARTIDPDAFSSRQEEQIVIARRKASEAIKIARERK